MSIIGVQIADAVHEGQHPARDLDCLMCDLRAGDYELAVAKVDAQQAEWKRNRKRRRESPDAPRHE